MLTNYRFSINGYKVNPVYGDDLSKEFSPESGEQFFRAAMNGKIKLIKSDFDWLLSQDIETEFIFLVEYYSNSAWADYWKGRFFKTDCEWDEDNKNVLLSFDIKDQYTNVLAGMNNEYDLIKLAPAKTKLKIAKRPLVQIYILGDDVVSCFLSGNYWEQDVLTPITDKNELEKKYYFKASSEVQKITVTRPDSSLDEFTGDYVKKAAFKYAYQSGGYPFTNFEITRGSYKIRQLILGAAESTGFGYRIQLLRVSDSVVLFETGILTTRSNDVYTTEFTLNAVDASVSGSLNLVWFDTKIFMRYLMDVTMFFGKQTYELPSDDFVSNNRNYQRAMNESFDIVTTSPTTQAEPTEWGLAEDGNYFVSPGGATKKYYPIARSTWSYSSMWLNFSKIDYSFEQAGQKFYTMKDSILISDVISALLAEIDPDIIHEATETCSSFLYAAQNPISAETFTLLLTQKSNILAGEYDKPAQKAPIKLSDITTMFKEVYQCYWFIENNYFKIEQIKYFKKGGSYSASPGTNVDLDILMNNKIKKPYSYGTNKYKFDKETMPERIEFSWMDEVSKSFEGYPIEINSHFVEKGNIQQATPGNFTTDIDLMLVNPSAFSSDGFALMAAVYNAGEQIYELPFVDLIVDNAPVKLQNGYLSWVYLQPNFWVYNLPTFDANINEQAADVKSIMQTKRQSVSYPSINDPDPMKLIKTGLGYGKISKLNINLSSRNNEIELLYDTK